MRVPVSLLRRACSLVFDHLESSGCAEIEIDEDYYWNIPDDRLYKVYEEPTGFTAGQLSWDVENVERVVAGDRPVIAYNLVWLASILRFVGAKIVA